MMDLMPEEIREKLRKFPICSQDGKGLEAEVVVKYFFPYGKGTWIITEGEEQPDGDWVLFGYCCIDEWEWGYVALSELKSVVTPFGGTIERDLHIPENSKVKNLI